MKTERKNGCSMQPLPQPAQLHTDTRHHQHAQPDSTHPYHRVPGGPACPSSPPLPHPAWSCAPLQGAQQPAHIKCNGSRMGSCTGACTQQHRQRAASPPAAPSAPRLTPVGQPPALAARRIVVILVKAACGRTGENGAEQVDGRQAVLQREGSAAQRIAPSACAAQMKCGHGHSA